VTEIGSPGKSQRNGTIAGIDAGSDVADEHLDGDDASSVRALLLLSMLMTDRVDEEQILNLATTSVPSLGPCRLAGVYLLEDGWRFVGDILATAAIRADVAAQLAVLGQGGGGVGFTGVTWGWAFPLRSLGGNYGYLVVEASVVPAESEKSLLRVLAQQTGIALANARLHARERTTAAELRVANVALADTVAALERRRTIHDRLIQAAASGQGQEGLVAILHDLTGCSVAVEDRHGNLRAWSGPGRPEPYPKRPASTRESLLRRAEEAGHPIRQDGCWYSVAHPREDIVGVLVLMDPDGTAGEQEQVAMELGATVLSIEFVRLQSLAETELRLGRDLLDHLLTGDDPDRARDRALALGIDLDADLCVVLVEGETRSKKEADFFHAVRRAARDAAAGTLVAGRGRVVVVVSEPRRSWQQFHDAVSEQLAGGSCRIGVGGTCRDPSGIPRSFREAELALRIAHATGGGNRTTSYDQLGIYQLLAGVKDLSALDRFVEAKIGALVDYDRMHNAELVDTLTEYLEHGASHGETAMALAVHRNTLKYRLRRIHEILDVDLGEPGTRFDLQLAARARRTLCVLRGESSTSIVPLSPRHARAPATRTSRAAP
jgi:sugar diacid utilization regulator